MPPTVPTGSPELAELQKITAVLAMVNARSADTYAVVQAINARLGTMDISLDRIDGFAGQIADNTTPNGDAVGFLRTIQNLLASMLYVGSSGGVEPNPIQAREYVARYGNWHDETD